jgi:hypothetical protein
MATQITPYIPQSPGDLLTAENFNKMQVLIKQDIASQVQTAVSNVKSVDHAADSDTLGGETPDQLTQAILKKAEEILPLRTGYFRSFNRLETGKEEIIRHGLKSFPLVDIYLLKYFPAACSKAENSVTPVWVNFYLYHTSERTITIPPQGANQSPLKAAIEPPDQRPFRVSFSDMLGLYQVKVTDAMTLDELETSFWTAFWNSPNNEFDADQYCHSPWFEKCCGEKRSVKELKDRGDWSNIWFKMVPAKVVANVFDAPATAKPPIPSPSTDPAAAQPAIPPPPSPSPVAPVFTEIEVNQHDFDNVGIQLLRDPIYRPDVFPGNQFTAPERFKSELTIMVLMKV